MMRIAHEIRQLIDNEDGKQILANIRTLQEQFEPEIVAKEQASKPRRAKAASRGYRGRGAYVSHISCLHLRDFLAVRFFVDTTEFCETLIGDLATRGWHAGVVFPCLSIHRPEIMPHSAILRHSLTLHYWQV